MGSGARGRPPAPVVWTRCNKRAAVGVLPRMTETSRRLMTTSEALNRGPFAPLDWSLFIATSLIWGSSFLLMDIGLEAFEPGLVTSLRVGLGAAALFLVPRAREVRIERDDWPRLLALAALWVAIPFTLFPIAQQHVNSAVAGMLNGATPIFATVISVALLRRLPAPRTMTGLVLGLGGIVAIGLPSAGEGPSEALGVGLIVTATLCYGLSLNIAVPLQQRYGSLPVMSRLLAAATVMTAPFGVVSLADSSFAWGSLLAVAAAGVVGTGIAFVVFGTLVGRVGSTRSSFITYLIPVVAVILGVLLRADVVTPLALAGMALATAGALLASGRD